MESHSYFPYKIPPVNPPIVQREKARVRFGIASENWDGNKREKAKGDFCGW